MHCGSKRAHEKISHVTDFEEQELSRSIPRVTRAISQMTSIPAFADSSIQDAQPATARGYLARAFRSMRTLAAFEALNKAARFGAAVLLARFLSLHDYGLVNVGIAMSGILVVLTGLGLPEVGAREVAVDHSVTDRTANRVLVGRGAGVMATTGAIVLGALVIHPGAISIVASAGVIALATSLSADWALRGREAMRAAGTATALGGVVTLVTVAIFVSVTRSPFVALGALALAEFVSSFFTRRKLHLAVMPVSLTSVAAMVKRSWPVGLATLVTYAYFANLDTVLLSVMRSADQAGLYSAPYRVFLAFNAIGIFAAFAFLPIIARGREAGEKALVDQALRTALVGLGAYGLAVLGLVLLAGRTLLVHLFGSRFGAVQDVFVVLCIGIPWFTMALPVGYGFIASDANRRLVVGAVLAGIVNIAVNLVLIPPHGALGAAIATSASFVTASVVWISFSDRGVHFILAVAALPVIATLAAAAALLARSSSTAVGIAMLVLAAAVVVRLMRAGVLRRFRPTT
jgi:O-antigen/teichoic acid export membrane protein